MLAPTSSIVGRGLGKDVALITDGRFSGATRRSLSATFHQKQLQVDLLDSLKTAMKLLLI